MICSQNQNPINSLDARERIIKKINLKKPAIVLKINFWELLLNYFENFWELFWKIYIDSFNLSRPT